MATDKEKKTLFYKLFSMSKREWDIEVKNHQQKLNKRQREYMLTFKEDITLQDEGLSPEQRRARRLKRMKSHLSKTMAKYGAASKAGIHPSKVHQRRTKLTVKK